LSQDYVCSNAAGSDCELQAKDATIAELRGKLAEAEERALKYIGERAQLYETCRACIEAVGGVANQGVSLSFLALGPGEIKAKIADLQAQLAASEQARAGLEAALKPFADHWAKVPLFMRETLEQHPDRYTIDGKELLLLDAKAFKLASEILSGSTSALQPLLDAAKAEALEAYANLGEDAFFMGVLTTTDLKERAAAIREQGGKG